MYDIKTDTYTEDFLGDVMEQEIPMNKIPGINAPQINSGISIES